MSIFQILPRQTMAEADLSETIIYTSPMYEVTLQELGSGIYGHVYLGRRKTSGESVAVKRIKLEHPLSAHKERQEVLMKREVKALGRINHPNIVKLYDVKGTEKYFYIFMEYCEHLDLEKYLLGKELSGEHMMRFIHQSAEAMFFMHTMRPNPIIHRDIKPANFLISTQDGQPQLKVADFGLARELGTSGQSITATQGAGNLSYRAPEVFSDISGHAHYNDKVDTFSLGIFILSILNYTKESGLKAITVKQECVGEWMMRSKRCGLIAYPPTMHTMQDASHRSSLKTMAHLMIQQDPADRIAMSDVCENIITINNALGFRNDPRIQHSTLTDMVFVMRKLSSIVVDVSCEINAATGPYPGVVMSSSECIQLYNLNADDQIKLCWKKDIPSGFEMSSLGCLDEHGNLWMQKDLDTIHVFDDELHHIQTLQAQGRWILDISEGFRTYATPSRPDGFDIWKFSLEKSDGTIVHTFQDREYKPGLFSVVVDPVLGRTLIAGHEQKILQIHDAKGARQHLVTLDYEPGNPTCTRDNIFVPVRGEARVDVYIWSGARLYSLDQDELGISGDIQCLFFTPMHQSKTILMVHDPNGKGEDSLHAYHLATSPSSCVLTSGSIDTTE